MFLLQNDIQLQLDSLCTTAVQCLSNNNNNNNNKSKEKLERESYFNCSCYSVLSNKK